MLSRFVVSQVKHNSYFLVGLALGLWLALAAVPLESGGEAACAAASAGGADEYAAVREERPLGGGGPARALQRPRYYTTELGMRAPLLAAVLSSEDALGPEGRASALNATAGRLGGALRFFMAASAVAAPGLPNVVGFTDTREMLKPFHALKYLADNYLDEYDFFFLVSDTSFVNARRLAALVAELSVSADVYMGAVADDDSHYCTLEGGILLSNSVLRAVHAELDWCVRNSYSAHHHENIGRCVLHAAHVACAPALHGARYRAARDAAPAPPAALAGAVTAHPVTEPRRFHELHAYVARVYLERGRAQERALRAQMRRTWRRHPPGYRNGSWPRGLRTDPGLADPTPDNRWDHLRWTMFNLSHAFMPDEHRSVAPLAGSTAEAVKLMYEAVSAWAVRRWGAASCELVEGAWLWQPAAALRYRLLLRLAGAGAAGTGAGARLRWVEAVKPLGAARLVPVPYVTESARVWLVLPVPPGGPAGEAALAFLRRYDAACLQRRANTALITVVLQPEGGPPEAAGAVAAAVRALAAAHPWAPAPLLRAAWAPAAPVPAARAALDAALGAAPRDALLLLADAAMDFNEDFLNRVRMNSIAGAQWFLPVPFARYAQYAHPRFVDAAGRKPQVNTGRFNRGHRSVLAVYRRDYEQARPSAPPAASVAEVLAGAALRCVQAPEPGLVLAPPSCRGPDAACLRGLRRRRFADLDLGARHTLAKLLLEVQAEHS
ncbi:chondroitin sulfate synthase 2 [Pectinophora gossypiella]|nr:chondroitin sulfate synthase 2 [Pectinophora gossypiella]